MIQGIKGAINISDDILIYGKNKEIHDAALKQVCDKLAEKEFTLNTEKCKFNQTEVEFFWHIFTKQGIFPDPKKVTAIENAERPQTEGDISSLLGLATYCSRFIPSLATITEPLRKLTQKYIPWSWGIEQETALKRLNEALCQDSMIAYYNPTKPSELIVDASTVGLVAMLVQEHAVVAYASKSLTSIAFGNRTGDRT